MEACSDVQGGTDITGLEFGRLSGNKLLSCANHMKDGRRCSTDIVVILVGPLYPLNPDWTLER